MRKNAKFVVSVLSLLLCFTTVSCSKDENKRKELSEEQIKENFNNEVTKVSLSKETLNSTIQSAIYSSSKGVDVDSMLDSFHLSNTKASITKTIGEEESSYDAYAWQKEEKIYLGSVIEEESTVYLLDLGTIKETISNAGSVELPDVGENTIDYVDLILSSLDVNIDLDQYLSKIKFGLSDFEFDYKNKTFTFTKEKLVNKVSEVLGITDATTKNMISTYLGEFSFQIGYDGYNFNEYKLVLKPNLSPTVGSFNPGAKAECSIEADLKLNHDLQDNIIGSSLSLEVVNESSTSFSSGLYSYSEETSSSLIIKMEATTEKIDVTLDAINKTKSSAPSFDYETGEYTQVSYAQSSEAKITIAQDNSKNTLALNGSFSQSYSSGIGEVTEDYSDKIDVALEASETALDLSVKDNDKEVVKVTTTKNEESVNAEITLTAYDEEDPALNQVTKIVITSGNVTIPSVLLENESSAIDIIEIILEEIQNIEISL